MLVTILVETRRAAQVESVIAEFRKLASLTRGLEVRRTGARGVYFLFKADEIEPFMEVARSLSKLEFVKPYMEFMYDNGAFHDGRVEDGEVTFFDDLVTSSEGALGFLENYTGIQGNVNQLLSVWSKEIAPTPDQKETRKQHLEWGLRSRADRSRQFAEQQKRREDKKKERSGEASGSDTAEALGFSASGAPRRIVETVQQINMAGTALIPFAVFGSELSPRASRAAFSAFASFFDKAPQKAAIFGLVREAYAEFTRAAKAAE